MIDPLATFTLEKEKNYDNKALQAELNQTSTQIS
jgi:hypothetical protein